MSEVDLAIVGFGFSGLSVLAHVLDRSPGTRVTIVADDHSGQGLAYGTRDPGHLLNVAAGRMGLWASAPDDFARWLRTAPAGEAARALGVAVPDTWSFAPRALYAAYLSSIRRATLERGGEQVRLLRGRVRSLAHDGERWQLDGDVAVRARSCVLATGHDRRPVFGALRHPSLHDDPWTLPATVPADGPVVLIGSGLTAIDAVLTLRRRGYEGTILAFSRNGRVPAGHTVTAPVFELTQGRADRLDSVSAIAGFIRRGHPGGEWRPALDALRPHTIRLWQRLGPAQQRAAIRRWSGLWNVHRHRMAPEVSDRIASELRARSLIVAATSELDASVSGGELTLAVRRRGARQPQRIAPATIIDCTGPQLRCADSPQPLLRDLVASGAVQTHPTGLGFAADDDHRVGRDLYALGPLLIGQRWESIAVPELRDSADAIARAVTLRHAPEATAPRARSRGPAPTRR